MITEPIQSKSRYAYRDGSSLPAGEGYLPHASTRFLNFDQASDADKLPELYLKREECCGCTACVITCPVGAVMMCPDEEGFEYPVVDAAKCIGCLRCVRICPFSIAMSDN